MARLNVWSRGAVVEVEQPAGYCQVVRVNPCQASGGSTAFASETSGCGRERGRLRNGVPFLPPPPHDDAIVGGGQCMAAGSKLVADCTEDGTEARRVPEALEPLETALSLANSLVRALDALVRAPAARGGQPSAEPRLLPSRRSSCDRSQGRAAPSEVPSRACERSAAPRGTPAALHQDVAHLARIIDHPPQPAPLTVDHQTEFIEVPDVGPC